MDIGTTLFLQQLGSIGDADLDRPSTLPGWTRRHGAALSGDDLRVPCGDAELVQRRCQLARRVAHRAA